MTMTLLTRCHPQPLQLNAIDLENSALSQSFGRYLWKFAWGGRHYWLKAQQQGISALHQQSFENELQHYLQLTERVPQVLLEYEVMTFTQLCTVVPDLTTLLPPYMHEAEQLSLLLLADSAALFKTSVAHLSDAQVLAVLLSSLDSLACLHQAGFVHGDLKAPHFRVNLVCDGQSNQFESTEIQSYLIDFEQAGRIGQFTVGAQTATPHYMAPELFHGQAKSVASDIYALAVIWWEWLSQRKLYEKSYLDWAYLHCQRFEVSLPNRFVQFEKVLKQMLAKNSQARCTDFYQIKQMLINHVQRKTNHSAS